MLSLARGLIRRNIQVDLLLARAEGPLLGEVPSGVKVVDLEAGNPVTKLAALVRYLRQERPSALLSALDNVNLGAWAAQIAGVETRVVVSVHNHLSRSMWERSGPLDRLRRVVHRVSYQLADEIVAVSDGVAWDLAEHSGVQTSRLHVIPNAVVTDGLEQAGQEDVDHPWFAPGQPPVIIGSGRLTAQKDFATLLRAFAQVRARRRTRLMILGEGELRPFLTALSDELGIAADVAMPGFVSNPYPLMKHAAVFALSSMWEGLPTVLIEAMALGTPVVATDCESGPREILRDGAYGTLVPTSDAEALADGICAALDRQPDPDALREAVEPYRAQHVERAYVDLLQRKVNLAPAGALR